MSFLNKYLLPRIMQFFIVIFIGVTVVFLIPRFSPSDPVVNALARLSARGSTMDPEVMKQLKESLKELYGLKGSLLEQYGAFWQRIFHGDFGPSLAYYPTSCIKLIAESMPWTLGLLVVSTLISWLVGTLLGGIAGFYYQKKWARAIEYFSMLLRPIPYYIMALAMVILFAFLLPLFPMTGGYSVGTRPEYSLSFLLDILYHAFLPALSLVLVGFGGWFLQMRSMSSTLVGEDFVTYAEISGLPKRKILFNYTMRNAILPQVTGLGLSLGMIFGGALITEQVFSYPGIGYLLYTAIGMADYNLIMGITLMSIVGVAFSVLVIDLLYPLLDPRVRLT